MGFQYRSKRRHFEKLTVGNSVWPCVIGVVLLCIFFTVPVDASSLTEKIDSYVSSYTRTNDFSGCVLAKNKAETLYSKCFGMANVEFGVPNSPSTKFKIGSISKQFTAVGILVLEDQGLLNTRDSVVKYLPEYKSAKNITIHHLLTHTSGVLDIYALPNFQKINRDSLSLKQVTDEIFRNELQHKPGTVYAYSNSGYSILARIIEEVSGTTYSGFLETNVFKPLELNSTGDYFDNRVIKNLAVGYDPKGYDGLLRPDYTNDVFVRGSGSIYSTVNDLSRWIDALRKGRILSKRSRQKLFTNHISNYGYGISVYKSFGKEVFGHDGRISGYIADYLHYNDDEISVVILGNIQTGVADFFRRDIAAIIFGKEYKSRAKTIPPRTTYPANYRSLVGKYQFGPNFFVFLELFDGVLKARANEGSYSELVPLETGLYFSRTLYSSIDFEFDESKKPTRMIWVNNDGNRFEGEKVN
ncbi:MAG: beta-lactamase family protein [Pyrinomonadaceae bacterium]|nr:beta-lactamase family protein [Pyrinomonadaceae bacterium]